MRVTRNTLTSPLPSRSSLWLRSALTLGSLLLVGVGHGLAQTPQTQTSPVAPRAAAPAPAPVGRVGLAVKMSTLGVSFEGAARLNRRANIRAGVNVLHYSHDFSSSDSNITYTGTLKLQSVDAYLDWFPFGGAFHISPGLLVRNSNKVDLSALITPGESVTLNNTDYVSSTSNPIRAGGSVTFEQTRPALLIGWGSLVPQNHRFSVPFEFGVVFEGAPIATLSFTGSACALNGTNCRDMASDATIQANIRADQAKLNSDIKFLGYYPVLSLGLAVRF